MVCHAVDEGAQQLAEHAVYLQVQAKGLWTSREALKETHILFDFKLRKSLNQVDKYLIVYYVLGEDITVTDDDCLGDPTENYLQQGSRLLQSFYKVITFVTLKRDSDFNQRGKNEII